MPSLRPLAFACLLVAVALQAAEPALISGPRPVGTGADGIFRMIGGDFDGDGKRDLFGVQREWIVVYPGRGDGTFGEPVPSWGVPRDEFLTTADVNGDGTLDVVFGGDRLGGVHVYLNNGYGHFDTIVALDAGTSGPVAAGDFTGDGKVDVLTHTSEVYAAGGKITVFPGDGSGNFGSAVTTAVTSAVFTARAIAAGDVNKDGKLDVMAGSNEAATLWYGDGDGTFTASAAQFDGGTDVALADFNRDGRLDVAHIGAYSNHVTVGLANGDGTFTAGRWMTAYQSNDLSAADMNGDGTPDLVTSAILGSKVSILLGRGDGTFAAPRIFLGGPGAHRHDVGDYDGDGKLDVAESDYEDEGAISLLFGNGDGSLDAHETYRARVGIPETDENPAPHGLRLADVTGDGKLDAITTSNSETTSDREITVLPGLGGGRFGVPLQTATGIAASDVDGHVVEDFDRDGKRDVVFAARTFVFFAGNGDGTFRRSTESGTNPAGLGDHLFASDFTMDGKLDLLVVGSYPSVYPGDGAGGFGAPITGAFHPSALGAAIADVDGDGAMDLVYNDRVLVNDRTGRFHLRSFGSDDRDYELAGVADLNEDGLADVITQTFTGSLRVRLNKGEGTFEPATTFEFTHEFAGGRGGGAPTAWADIDGDTDVDLVFGTAVLLGDGEGSFEGFDELRFAGTPTHIALADVDGNGSIDITGIERDSGTLDVILTRRKPGLDVPTTLTLTPSQDAPFFSQEVEYIAQVTGGSTWRLGGAVRFDVDGKIAGIAALDREGKARFLRKHPVGPHAVTATYLPNHLHVSSSARVQHHVTRAKMQMYVDPPDNPMYLGEPFAIYYSVYPRHLSSVLTYPTGTVTFRSGSTVLGTTPPSWLTARTVVDGLPVGKHVVIADYSGDDNYEPTLTAWEQVVQLWPPALNFSVSPAAEALGGQPVTMTVLLTDTATGTMTFFDRDTELGTVPVAGGRATFTTTSLQAGSHELYATYSGDEKWGPHRTRTIRFHVSMTKRRAAGKGR